jgi:hypothetical protein
MNESSCSHLKEKNIYVTNAPTPKTPKNNHI